MKFMKNKVQTLFADYPEIELAYQYGSGVKQNFDRAKDVDIAVSLKKSLSPEKRLDIQLEIADRLEKQYRKPVDLVLLNTASPFLAYQVIKYGKLLYGDEKCSRDFVVQTLTRYFDALSFHQFFVNRLKKELGVRPHGR